MSFKRLKAEVASLSALFPRDHKRVRIVSTGYDEIIVHFLDGKKKFVMTCTGLDSYLETPPMWFTDEDDASIVSAIEEILNQGKITITGSMLTLLSTVCQKRSLSQLPELSELREIEASYNVVASSSSAQASASGGSSSQSSACSCAEGEDDDEEDDDVEDGMDVDSYDEEMEEYGMELFSNAIDPCDGAAGVDSGCDMDAGDRAVLEKVKKIDADTIYFGQAHWRFCTCIGQTNEGVTRNLPIGSSQRRRIQRITDARRQPIRLDCEAIQL
eukprot:scpid78214/ scgid27122/ Ubiquitin-conjugating enzyme E2 Q2; Ubiquitin carrier protein Q2; Ubiquitin-protein ligase Q2